MKKPVPNSHINSIDQSYAQSQKSETSTADHTQSKSTQLLFIPNHHSLQHHTF